MPQLRLFDLDTIEIEYLGPTTPCRLCKCPVGHEVVGNTGWMVTFDVTIVNGIPTAAEICPDCSYDFLTYINREFKIYEADNLDQESMELYYTCFLNWLLSNKHTRTSKAILSHREYKYTKNGEYKAHKFLRR